MSSGQHILLNVYSLSNQWHRQKRVLSWRLKPACAMDETSYYDVFIHKQVLETALQLVHVPVILYCLYDMENANYLEHLISLFRKLKVKNSLSNFPSFPMVLK